MTKANHSIVTIRITDLHINALIGVFDHERNTKQPLTFDIRITYNGQTAMKSDDINDALDYNHIEEQIQFLVKNTHYYLLERLADEVLHLLSKNEKVVSCDVTIYKPNALKKSGAMVSVSATSSINK